MSDDQEQRSLEVIKLRITFLQHITTLSGAATLIILAIMQRIITDRPVVWALAYDLFLFALAALVSVVGIVYLINIPERTDRPLQGSAGRWTTIMAGSIFMAGVLSVLTVTFKIPLILGVIVTVLAGMVVTALIIIILRATEKPRSNEPENGEDQDATPRP